MRRTVITLVAVASGLTAGCVSGERKPFANNPALQYYKPTLSDSTTILAEQATRRDPAKPPMPALARDSAAEALSMQRRPDEPIRPVRADTPPVIRQSSAQPERKSQHRVELPDIVPVAPTRVSSAADNELIIQAAKVELSVPVSATGAVVLPDAPQPPAVPVPKPSPERRTVPGMYGHDADRRWLQGVVQRLSRGGCFIRYRDPSEEDEYGGKVQVENPTLLAGFRDGEVVAVKGELTGDLYRVQHIWPVSQTK